jgi:hypothetical protein
MQRNNLFQARARFFLACLRGAAVATQYLTLRKAGATAGEALADARVQVQRCSSLQFHEVCERTGVQIVFTRLGDVSAKLNGQIVAVMLAKPDADGEPRHFIDRYLAA